MSSHSMKSCTNLPHDPPCSGIITRSRHYLPAEQPSPRTLHIQTPLPCPLAIPPLFTSSLQPSNPSILTMHFLPLVLASLATAPSLAAPSHPPCNPHLKGRKICGLDYDGQIAECNGKKWVKSPRCPYPKQCYYDGEMCM